MTGLIKTHLYEAPCGLLLLGEWEGQLCMCDWLSEPHHHRVAARMMHTLEALFAEEVTPVIERAIDILNCFFTSKPSALTDIPLLLIGTDFQKTVWRALCDIPFGHTESYASLARRIGKPSAVRAVANAIGANSISIFVPCHRIVGADGGLTGYAGGLDAKQYILNLEKDTNL